jgi:hypothetical protein
MIEWAFLAYGVSEPAWIAAVYPKEQSDTEILMWRRQASDQESRAHN